MISKIVRQSNDISALVDQLRATTSSSDDYLILLHAIRMETNALWNSCLHAENPDSHTHYSIKEKDA